MWGWAAAGGAGMGGNTELAVGHGPGQWRTPRGPRPPPSGLRPAARREAREIGGAPPLVAEGAAAGRLDIAVGPGAGNPCTSGVGLGARSAGARVGGTAGAGAGRGRRRSLRRNERRGDRDLRPRDERPRWCTQGAPPPIRGGWGEGPPPAAPGGGRIAGLAAGHGPGRWRTPRGPRPPPSGSARARGVRPARSGAGAPPPGGRRRGRGSAWRCRWPGSWRPSAGGVEPGARSAGARAGGPPAPASGGVGEGACGDGAVPGGGERRGDRGLRLRGSACSGSRFRRRR